MDAPPPPAPPPSTPPPGHSLFTAWTHPAQLAAAFLLGAALMLLAVRLYEGSRWAGRPTELERGAVLTPPLLRPAVPGQPVAASPVPKGPPKSIKEASLTEPINVNEASQEELQRLPGIGPKMSQRILVERARGRFKSVDELRRVSGIGPKTLEKVRPYVTVGDSSNRVAGGS